MDFNKEKQTVEEMAIDLSENIVEVWNNNWNRYVFDCKATAESMIKEGYCKQKEGKWLVADTLREDDDGSWSSYSCSECGATTGAYYKDPLDISRFCPNCGARMKK